MSARILGSELPEEKEKNTNFIPIIQCQNVDLSNLIT